MPRQTRHQIRLERMRRRVTDAETPQARLAAAFDLFRWQAEYLGRRGTRQPGHCGPLHEESARILAEATEYLTGRVTEMERSRYDYAG